MAEIFCIFECLLTQNPTNQGSKLLTLPDHMKEQGFLFLAENDFKTSSAVDFPKKRPDFGDLEANQRHERQAT